MSLALPLIGGRPVDPPVVLAPMAGITNRAFRRLCRESGAGIYVSEMITSRALLERNDETMDLIRFDADEAPRSLQLYGVDPAIIAAAVRMVVTEDLADHVDLNFGCPVPKVTRKGGGSALPWKRDLFREVVAGAVAAADGRVPVTVKMRKGIDDEHLTYLEAGRAAAQEGAAWVALHGRTAEQMYGGQADWSAIARAGRGARPARRAGPGQRRHLDRRGRAAHGRADRLRRRRGRARLPGPALAVRPARGGVRRCAAAPGADLGRGAGRPAPACRAARSRCTTTSARAAATSASTWPGTSRGSGSPSRSGPRWARSARSPSSTTCSRGIDPDQPYPSVVAAGPRGRTSGQRRVALPDGWLDSCELARGEDLSAAEIGVSGG